jgi:hypothetical protein
VNFRLGARIRGAALKLGFLASKRARQVNARRYQGDRRSCQSNPGGGLLMLLHLIIRMVIR